MLLLLLVKEKANFQTVGLNLMSDDYMMVGGRLETIEIYAMLR